MERQVKLQAKNVRKTYGPIVTLEGTSIDLLEGEFLTLLGPSGSGKTTLLMAIAGLNDPDSGEIWIDGELMTYTPSHQRGLGMVFQNYALFPHLTIYENIAFPLKMRKMSKDAIDEQVARVLSTVQLPDVQERFPAELSGGQQQRIALARCFVYEPSIILMDEPLGALDKKLRDSLQREIKHLHNNLGITVIYVTHDQEEAMVMSDRVCLMNEGRIEQIGSPSELYFRPNSIFAADFLGESNLFAGKVVSQAAGAMTIERADGVAVSGICDAQVSNGETAHYMIRPENIRVSLDKGSEENLAGGKLKETIMIGQLTKYFLELADESELVATTLTGSQKDSLQDGDQVYFGWSTGDARIMLGS
ncbi:MAG: ABC transporter ATP-binding protein [Proteobacteria bacterium]|nr:ABC transporter ATP-binding protein [Pseudomonadota bacterium]